MSSKAIINGNEYSYGEIVESEILDDKNKEIVLNGDVVKVGDVWLTRELKEVVITNISIGRWPIRDNKDRTYTVEGITDYGCKISSQDLMTKYVKDIPYTEYTDDTENTEAVKDTENTEAVKDTENTEAVKDDAMDALRYSTIENVCSKDTTINFENAVKMHMDSIVSLIGDRICEKVKSRDISSVKYLTKVLEKVIALESL